MCQADHIHGVLGYLDLIDDCTVPLLGRADHFDGAGYMPCSCQHLPLLPGDQVAMDALQLTELCLLTHYIICSTALQNLHLKCSTAKLDDAGKSSVAGAKRCDVHNTIGATHESLIMMAQYGQSRSCSVAAKCHCLQSHRPAAHELGQGAVQYWAAAHPTTPSANQVAKHALHSFTQASYIAKAECIASISF